MWLLGGWRAELDGEQIPPLPTRHARALLARLARIHPTACPRSQLCADLFPHAAAARAAGHLRTTAYYVRRATDGILISDDHEIGLDPNLQVWHDAGRFEVAAAPQACRQGLEEALRLYRGRFLGGPLDGWAAGEAERLHELHISVLKRLVALAQSEGAPERVLEPARRWAEEEPWEEAAHWAYVSALIATDNYAQAAAHLARSRAALPSEFRRLDEFARLVARQGSRSRRSKKAAPPSPMPDAALHALAALPSSSPAERMIHHAGAGEWRPALKTALGAARQALQEARPVAMQDALAVAERALGQIDPAPGPCDPLRWEWLALRESCLAAVEHHAAWLAALDGLDSLAQASGRIEWQVEAWVRRGRALRECGQLAAAREILEQAAGLAREAGLFAAEAEARSLLAAVLNWMGDISTGWQEAEAAVTVSARSRDKALTTACTSMAAFMQMYAGQPRQAAARLPAHVAQQMSGSPRAAQVYRNLGSVRVAAGEIQAGLDLLREGVRQAQAGGDIHESLTCQTALASVLLCEGQIDEGRTIALAVLPSLRRIGTCAARVAILDYLARALFYAGEAEEAGALIDESAQIVERLGMPEYASATWAYASLFALKDGRLEEARQTLVRVEQAARSMPHPILNVGHIAASVWLGLGERERAWQAAQKAPLHMGQPGLFRGTTVEALWRLAQVLAALCGPEEARPVRERAYGEFLHKLEGWSDPARRRALIASASFYRELSGYASGQPRRLVWLPLAGAPLGRRLQPDEMSPVVWTLHVPGDPPLDSPAGRRQRIVRLTGEALAQGAEATVPALAEALCISPRSLLRDLATLRQAGRPVVTRHAARATESH